MKSDLAEEQEARALLQMIRDQIDVTGLSDEDREKVARWWAANDETDPKKVAVGGMPAMVFPIFDPGDLEPRQAFCALALRAYASAIRDGLQGGEHLAEEFLRDCGFEEAAAREILEQMVASAPPPDPEDLN